MTTNRNIPYSFWSPFYFNRVRYRKGFRVFWVAPD